MKIDESNSYTSVAEIQRAAVPSDPTGRFVEILDSVNYRHYDFKVALDGGRPYLQAMFLDKSTVTGEDEMQYGRKWFLSQHMTKSEVVQTAFKAVLAAEEHECRENFKYRGEAIFGPHYNVDVLAEICNIGGHQDKRAAI